MMQVRTRMLTGVLSVALMVVIPGPAYSGNAGQSCSCQNLESLQQEVANAEYEAKFFADLARRLKAIEDKQVEINKDATNPDSGRSVLAVSGTARKDIMDKEFKLPNPQVKDTSGPDSVDMIWPSCKQNAADLDALKTGASCKEVADIVLEHEAQHRAICEKLTAKAYWARLPSELAAEEAQRYGVQAKAMREALKHVIDGGTFKVSAILEPRVFGPQFDVTYSYVTDPMELQGKSSPGADTWTLKGDGHQAGTIKKARIAGMNCSSSGQLNDAVNMTMETDGFSMGLKENTQARPGDVKIRCKKGFGMSLRPQSDKGGGTAFENQPLQLSSEIVRDVSTMDFAKMLRQGGMSVSGEARMTVELICPGQ